ncbi:MAG: hypothetical protein RBJ76_18220 [Stenomitos frigidus ULC029]
MYQTNASADGESRRLQRLNRTRQMAIVAMFGCFMAVFCLLLTVTAIKRTYSKQPPANRFDLIGVLLGTSAFTTVIGSGLSVWLVMDISAEHRALNEKHSPNQRQ